MRPFVAADPVVTLMPLRLIKGLLIACNTSQGGGRPLSIGATLERGAREERRHRGDGVALACVAILIGLGIWQLDRKTWKENLIETVTSAHFAGAGRSAARAKCSR